MAVISPHWRTQLSAFDTLWVGFSGGLDSTVLLHALHALPELQPRLRAVHINHGLSAQAHAWQQHCARVCAGIQIPFVTKQVTLVGTANLEAQARAARQQCFAALITANSCLLLAHHQADQAETLLLQLCRGAGVAGLAAMPSCLPFHSGLLARPLLHQTKATLLAYATAHQLDWVEDESNACPHFSRNYLRHSVLPSLQARWPGVMSCLVQAANHCQQAQANLVDLAHLDYPGLAEAGRCLAVTRVAHLPPARLNNLLRVWLAQQGISMPSTKTFQRLQNELIAAKVDGSPCVAWGNVEVRRYRQTLYLLTAGVALKPAYCAWHDFPAPLVNSCGVFVAKACASGVHVPESSVVELRFREGGETLVWQGKSRRLKHLLQTWGVTPWLRDKIPLLYVDTQLAAVVDFCISDRYYKNHPARVFQINARLTGVAA